MSTRTVNHDDTRPAPVGFTILAISILFGVFGFGGGFIIGSSNGISTGMGNMQRQAVEHNSGHWAITKEGEPVWKWGPPPRVIKVEEVQH